MSRSDTEVRLDATHRIIEISPGVKYAAWTFGDQVPGLSGRARVGDRIRFTMPDRSDEVAPGLTPQAAQRAVASTTAAGTSRSRSRSSSSVHAAAGIGRAM